MKVFNYIMITTVLMVMFALAGFDVTGSLIVKNNFGINVNSTEGYPDLGTSDFYKSIFLSGVGLLALAAAAAAGVALAKLTNSPAENYLIAPIITTHIVVFVNFLINLGQYLASNAQSNTVISGIIAIILVPLTIGYIFSCVEFFRGTD